MVTSKTSLDFHSLLSYTIIKILLHKKFIKKIKLNPDVEKRFGKTNFIIQIDFETDPCSFDVLGSIKFDQMQKDLLRNSLSRTNIHSLSYNGTNYLNVMMEINEYESNYKLLGSTIRSFFEQSGFLGYDCLEFDFYFSLQKELDSLQSFPLHQFRKKVINKFFYGTNATISSRDLSDAACHKAEEIENQKKIQLENELKKHLANLKLVADVGDYCIVTKEYHQPLNLMEITAIGQGFNDTYIGFEVRTSLKTGLNVIKTINANIACIITKEVFENVYLSLLAKTRSKATMINFLIDTKNNSQIKYFNKALLQGKVRSKLQFKSKKC